MLTRKGGWQRSSAKPRLTSLLSFKARELKFRISTPHVNVKKVVGGIFEILSEG